MKFSEVQEILHKNFGIDHLADIARELGVTPQAVSNWKSRDRVPYKYVIKIRNKVEENIYFNDEKPKDITDVHSEIESKYAVNTNESNQDTVTITDIILIFTKYIRTILIIPTIMCIYTIIYALYYTTPVFESSAKIMSAQGGGASQAAAIASKFGFNISSNQSESQWIYPEIIKSHTFARRMLDYKFTTKKFGSEKTLLQILTYGNDEKPEVGLDTLIRDGCNGFIGMVNMNQDGSYYMLTISASEAIFARDIAVVVIEELDSYLRQSNKDKTSETRQFIEERIDDTEKNLKIAEEVLKDFRVRNRRLENSPALLLEQQRLSREVSVLTGVFTSLKQQLETAKIEEIKDSDYIVVLDPPLAPFKRSRPNKKRMVIVAGFVGIGLGCALALIREYFAKNFQRFKKELDYINPFFLQNIFNLFKNNKK